MATVNKTLQAGVGLVTDIHTSQLNPLGFIVPDENGNQFIYLPGVASVIVGDWVFYNSATYATTRVPASTATNGFLAVAMAAVVANNWGWFQVGGLVAVANIATDASADGKLISAASGTIGQMKTGPTTTKNVFNAVCVGASASNQGSCFINFPFEFGSATI